MENVSSHLDSDQYYQHVDQVLTQINIFCTAGSGWVIRRLIDIKLCNYRPLRPGSFIPTPRLLQPLRRTVLNIKNFADGLCFIYCILAALFPVSNNQERPKKYTRYLKKLRFNKERLPMPLSQIPRFEKDNNVKINVYTFEEPRTIYPAYLTKIKGGGKPINLLVLNDDKKSHFCLIKNLDRLLKTLLRSDRTANSKNNLRKFCERRLQSVARTKMQQHRQLCLNQQPLMIEITPEGATTEFTSWHKTTKCPFVIYADLEAFNVRTDNCEDVVSDYQHGDLNSGAAATHVIEQQHPCSFGAVLVDVRDGKVAHEMFYRGENCIKQFLDTMRHWLRWTAVERQRHRKLQMTEVARQLMIDNWVEPCCICESKFSLDDDVEIKVVHHCHLTGKVIGVAHSKCNLKVTAGSFVPIFFHNLSRYDSHHIIKNLKLEDKEELSVIARTEETFISFSIKVPIRTYFDKCGKEKTIKHELRFLDSMNFMASSLDALSKTLEEQDLRILRSGFQHLNDKDFRKISKKRTSHIAFLTAKKNSTPHFLHLAVSGKTPLPGKLIFQSSKITKRCRFTIYWTAKTLETITMPTSKLMFLFSLTFLKNSEMFA